MRPVVSTLIFFFCSLFLLSKAQKDTDSIKKNNFHEFRFNYDNDFFSATDRYYTQGIYLEFVLPVIKKSPISKLLIPVNKQAVNSYGMRFEQDVFTPASIRHESIYYGERPYAALFLISHELRSSDVERKQRLTTAFDLGIIGPPAKGEEEQKGIHKALNNIQPLGWQYQLSTDYLINYMLRFEKGLIEKKYVQWIGLSELKLGTLYDNAGIGTMLRVGWMSHYFETNKIFKQGITSKFQFYFFGKVTGTFVAYNATLRGGVFNKDAYTLSAKELERTVAAAQMGLVMRYKNISLEYTKVYLSPEFKNGMQHGWGHCAVAIYF